MGAGELLSGARFEELFSSFSTSAYRLESRESYYEQDELNAYLAGGPKAVPEDFLKEWFQLMRSHRSAGRTIRRVRVVSEPHSDYTRFGLWLSAKNVEAGEDIRYLPRPTAAEISVPRMDYWLFDDSRLYIVHFAADDSLLGAEQVQDDKQVQQAREWRDVAWARAIPRAEYARAHPPKEGLD